METLIESSLLAASIKHAALDFSRSSGDEQHIAFKSGDLNERYMETLIVRNFLAAGIKHAVLD